MEALIETTTFHADGRSVPNTFDRAFDFHFDNPQGHYTHRILNPGPKGFKIVHVLSSGHSGRFVENDRTTISLTLQGQADVQVGTRAFSARPGQMVALGPSERNSWLRPEVPGEAYESYAVISPPNWPYGMPEDTLYRATDPKRLKLLELLRFSFSYRSNPELLTDRTVSLHEALVEDALIAAIGSVQPTRNLQTYAYRTEKIAKQVEDYIHDNFREALTMTQISEELGYSLRVMQKSFRARKGMSVRSFLSAVRLDAMHAALVAAKPGMTVTRAAVDAGLFHLGRSSAAYRAQYGELPSETFDRHSRASGDLNSGCENDVA
ncbi:helix-turn-helix domain-containing protein [Sedimentitalea sp. JM2-8]|uniref:Helix-turn-helix domain-containing protein n=1 Tax=Sedimentitalea xiamensis TaxID=3050037 RepID=A0ABT7FJI4_9RHOB|nr:helix-turn-helix domain-containing protein [Sedimentitalea xiamensis]MDK3075296.1 helix-turn-helix domain-containing protein [Sedimentitalea xiamensis]